MQLLSEQTTKATYRDEWWIAQNGLKDLLKEHSRAKLLEEATFFHRNFYLHKIIYHSKMAIYYWKTKGQLILKGVFCIFNFLQKTNKNKSHSSKIKFLCLFFLGNVGLKKSFQFCLTFRTMHFRHGTSLLSTQWAFSTCVSSSSK